MLVKDKKHFNLGLAMAVGFLAVFAYMFTPNFGNGQNAFEASDKMFNSISKGSTNYIPMLKDQAKAFDSTRVDLIVLAKEAAFAERAMRLLSANNLSATLDGSGLRIQENLGAILGAALDDSKLMFNNNGADLTSRYGMPEKEAMYVWWKLFQSMDKSLKAKKQFKEAKFTATVVAKGVEVGYNYYKVEPESASSKMGMLVFSLVFYVVYTLWWGYSIFFLFEGVGLVMKAGAKKEM
ncbi:hypothetical protein [Desulfovibrio ferrophilus]|uniref:Uncharacterized protein n=1 Tax=Desulfovibrio ferrophilus TaxID=241368 RepID=A0A2Z6B0R5_9BACT|nr:hypothetical protein [Desulfovibrio ferrophilus]BBD09074.1 uncharacterized protein DFE_2348 [Desulfovibrio ferrophilus]